MLGDFNVAPEDRDVHDPAAWVGCVHVSAEERAALKGILEIGLIDTFRQFEQPEKSFSWWDYRQGAFRRNNGLRIDLILAHQALSQTLRELPHRRRAAARRNAPRTTRRWWRISYGLTVISAPCPRRVPLHEPVTRRDCGSMQAVTQVTLGPRPRFRLLVFTAPRA